MRVRNGIFFGKCIAAGGAAALIVALGPAAQAAMVGGYLFDGTAGTANPATVAETGGNVSQDLSIGSCATYNADTPFAYAGNTSLDVACGVNARAANLTTNAYEFQNTDAFTVKVWMKTDSTSGSRQIVGQRQNNSGNGWQIFMQSNNTVGFFTQGTTVPQGRGASSTSVLNDNQWHQIIGIHDPNFDADGAHQIYVDGVLEQTASKSQTEPFDWVSFDPDFSVGAGFDGGGAFNPFSGLIDEVGIFDFAFTQADVDAAFANSMLPEPASLALMGLGGLLLARRRR